MNVLMCLSQEVSVAHLRLCVCVYVCAYAEIKVDFSTGLWDIVIDNVCSVNVHAR